MAIKIFLVLFTVAVGGLYVLSFDGAPYFSQWIENFISIPALSVIVGFLSVAFLFACFEYTSTFLGITMIAISTAGCWLSCYQGMHMVFSADISRTTSIILTSIFMFIIVAFLMNDGKRSILKIN